MKLTDDISIDVNVDAWRKSLTPFAVDTRIKSMTREAYRLENELQELYANIATSQMLKERMVATA